MHISSKSWHLRWVRFLIGSEYRPVSLCTYFWTIMWCVTPMLFPLLLYRWFASIDDRLGTIYPHHHTENMNGGATFRILVAGMFGLVVLPVWAFSLLFMRFGGLQRKEEKSGAIEKAPKELSILMAWVRAKKQKVCPLITVVEEA